MRRSSIAPSGHSGGPAPRTPSLGSAGQARHGSACPQGAAERSPARLAPHGRVLRSLVHLALLLAASLSVVAPVALAQDTAAPAPADANTGIVRVASPKPGATVRIDNEEAGDAPVTRYLPEGPHTFRVSVDGYEPYVRRITVTPGTTIDVTAQLVPGKGTVEFQVEPAGAKLIINNKQEWPLPVRLSDVGPGKYIYRIEAPGYETVNGSFEFSEGRNLFFAHTLRPTRGLFSFSSAPDGAEVFLDGTSVGCTPLELTDIPPGAHSARLDLDGYSTVIRAMDTSDGSMGLVNVRLPTQGARLVVHTHHADAAVTVDGTPIGTGRVVRIPSLERGHYDVTVTAPGLAPATGRADVPPKGQVGLRARLRADAADSAVLPSRPLYQRWVFWTAVGVGAAGGVTAAVLIHNATVPDPVPEGDVVVYVP